MRKFFTGLVLIPLGLVFIVFAVANRHLVTASFDPFNSADPSMSVRLPLFVLIIAVAILGVLAGGSATLFRQRHLVREVGRPLGAKSGHARGHFFLGRKATCQKQHPACGKSHEDVFPRAAPRAGIGIGRIDPHAWRL